MQHDATAIVGQNIRIKLVAVTIEDEPDRPEELSEKEDLRPVEKKEEVVRFVSPKEEILVDVPPVVPEAREEIPKTEITRLVETSPLKDESDIEVSIEISSTGSEVESGYWQLVRSDIMRAIRYPSKARRRGLEGTVQLRIAINGQGNIVQITAAEPRIHGMLEQAAIGAVVRAAPFEPPGDHGLRGNKWIIELPIQFASSR